MPTRPPIHRPNAPTTKRHDPKKQDWKEWQSARALPTNSTAWRKMRAAHLSREPLCRMCGSENRVTAATLVDHFDGNAMNNDPENFQSLCLPCHARKSAVENGAFGKWTMTPKWLPVSTKPLVVVYGPPGAGKTTYVHKKAKPGDLVLDLDAIANEMGMTLGLLKSAQIGRAVAERNNRLRSFARGETPHPRCWLIATAASMKEQVFWDEKGASLVLLNPGPTECKKRINQDKTRPEEAKRMQCAAVDRWGRT